MRVEVLACKAYAADADARSIRRWAICAGLIWLALCREAVEWAEFGPMELDERLLTRPEVHTMVSNFQRRGRHVQSSHYHEVPTGYGGSCLTLRPSEHGSISRILMLRRATSTWRNSTAEMMCLRQRWRQLPGSCMCTSVRSSVLIPLRGRMLRGITSRAGGTAEDLSLVRHGRKQCWILLCLGVELFRSEWQTPVPVLKKQSKIVTLFLYSVWRRNEQ